MSQLQNHSLVILKVIRARPEPVEEKSSSKAFDFIKLTLDPSLAKGGSG